MMFTGKGSLVGRHIADRGAQPRRVGRSEEMELRGKKVIALGERDGVPGPAVAECARRAGAEVILTLTACYV
jgi:betaine reductase